MRSAWQIVSALLFIFFLFLIGRLVFDWVRVLARSWRPTGIVLILAEAVYTVTDPPLRAIRKVVPSLNLGTVRIDLAFIILCLITSTLMSVQPV